LFTRVYGKDIPLRLALSFSDFDVEFGKMDTSVRIEYTTLLQFKDENTG